jgi:hypothetical protein
LEPLPPESATRLRQAALDALVRSFLAEADRLGFEPDEVAMDVETLIDRWRQEGAPPEDGK